MSAPFQLFDALPSHIEDALRASIQRFGVLVPITVDQHGTVLDGHHRKRIADELKVPYDRLVRVCESDEERQEIARTLNADRRQLSEEQRRQVVVELRQRGHSERAIAGALGVNQSTVHRDIQKAEIDAPASIQPERVARQGGGSYPARRPQVIARDDREQRRAEVALQSVCPNRVIEPQHARSRTLDVKRAERIAREAAAEQRAEREQAATTALTTPTEPAINPPDVQPGQWWRLGRHLLYVGDTTSPEFINRAHGAAFAFADPPYNAGKADWDHSFTWGHDYLTEAARIVAVTPGISAVADFYRTTAMPYRWSIAAWISNGMTRGALGFGNWIYIGVFSAAYSIHRNAQDHLRLTVDTSTTGDTQHASRKPARLMVELIELFTKTGDTVIDPFLGSGTTLFAAEATGRCCVGGELDPEHCAEIIARYGDGATLL